MDPSARWARFRSWPIWAQVLTWLVVWPVLIGLYTLTRPRGDRRGWWMATAALALWWIILAVGLAAGDTESDNTVTATHEANREQALSPESQAKSSTTTTPTTESTTTTAPATVPT